MTKVSVFDPVNANFEAVGYEYRQFMLNIGTLIFMFMILPMLALVSLLLGFKPCGKKSNSWSQSLKEKLFWNAPIRMLTESYSIIAMCALINLMEIGKGNSFRITNTVSSIVAIVLVILLPILVPVFLYKNWENLNDEDFKKKYGALYEELKIEESKWVLLEPVFFFGRRFFLAVVLCLSKEIFIW